MVFQFAGVTTFHSAGTMFHSIGVTLFHSPGITVFLPAGVTLFHSAGVTIMPCAGVIIFMFDVSPIHMHHTCMHILIFFRFTSRYATVWIGLVICVPPTLCIWYILYIPRNIKTKQNTNSVYIPWDVHINLAYIRKLPVLYCVYIKKRHCSVDKFSKGTNNVGMITVAMRK